MLNPLRDFVAFDLETTGLERDVDEIIEIGAVLVRGGSIEARMSCLVKAEKALTPLVESLTGITKSILEGAREAKDCLEEFLRFSEGLPLVAHNSDFDSAFLEHALAKAALPALANPVYDSLLLARVAWPSLASHRLESLVEKLGIPPQKVHRALPDAEQAALLWLKAEEKLAGYSPRTLATLGGILASGPSHWKRIFPGADDSGLASVLSIAAVSASADASPPAVSANPIPGKPFTVSAESLFASGKMAEAFAALGRPYQARNKQARMASLAERAFKESRFLVAEAEPGTGRMLACLVSALLQAKSRKRPVFIAVAGRGRIERIVTSEVPLLKALLDGDARVEPLKEPGNYLSPCKLAGILAHPDTRLSREERLALLPIITWLEDAGDGDIAANMGFNHERNKLLWSKLASDSYAVEPGSHAYAARARAQKAHLVLITQDLFLDDLALDFALLPSYEMILLDEAHHLPEAGQARLGREVSFFRLKHILQTIAQSKQDAGGLLAEMERQAGGPGQAERASVPDADSADGSTGGTEGETKASEPKTDLERLRRMVFEPERQLQKFFNKIAKHAAKRRKDGESRIRYADKLVVEFNAGPENVIASISELEGLLASLAGPHEDLAPDLRRAADQLRKFRSDLEHLAHPSGIGEVFWIEDFPNPHRALIRSAPLEIGTFLGEKFYPQMDAVVFASSAIAVGEEFKFFCGQIGLETAFPERLKTALVRSKDPQDRPQPLLLARFSPVLSNNGALQSMGHILTQGLLRFKKPSFLLFTHIGMLKQARALLQDGICRDGRMVLAQHVDGSRDNLLHLFRHRPDACLLGTEAFVEGLGEGDMLPEIVAVTKLPFPVPTEPLIAPHLEKLQEAGLNPLYDYLLPCSILRLKQELNRLPRRPGFRFALWILDPRLATEKYARYYQRGLGRDAIFCETEEDLFSRTASMLAGEMPVSEEAGVAPGSEAVKTGNAETVERTGIAGEPAT